MSIYHSQYPSLQIPEDPEKRFNTNYRAAQSSLWAAPYPSKEQTDAVNAYLRSVHADGDGTMSENNIAHRRIATQKITISAIRVLDHYQLDRLQDVLNRIAADREYHMPEQRYGMGR